MPRPSRRALVLVLLAAGTAALGLGAARADDDLFALRKNFTLFGRIYEILASDYMERTDPERLMRTGLGAMTESLDPYTVFFDEATTAQGRLEQGQDVGGVGIVVGPRPDGIGVAAVLDASSAEAQGVRVGDRLVEIAGRDAGAMGVATATELLRGQPGSTVEVAVAREGEAAPLRFALERARPDRTLVPYAGWAGAPTDGIAVVRLATFLGTATGDVQAALRRLAEERPVRGLVLDLRGNPGGLLDEAVALTSLFVPAGTLVVSTRGRAEGTSRAYHTTEPPAYPDLPVAVLVDGQSASASEIVAGALQDHDRGAIVGEPTFGKGLVQVVRPLPYGTALKVTVSRYATPAGREIQRLSEVPSVRAAATRPTLRTAGGRTVRGGGGIEPDVAVGAGEASAFEDALVRAAAFSRFADRYRAETPALPASFRADAALRTRFQRFLADERIAVETPAVQALAALERELGAAGYGAASEVAALRRAVERETARDVERHGARVGARLVREILSRYVGPRDLTAALLADDPALARARDLVADPAAMRRTLGR